jgi:ADP-heptose:LPS heptosyltransferase
VSAHVLVARLDSAGDVLLAGPAIRAVAARAGRVTVLCGPRGEAAARLLPGVDGVLVHHAAWIDAEPERLDRGGALALADAVGALGVDEALILTSFHQSALPTALLLRMAGVATVAAISDDYPGSLLDVRHRVPDGLHEVERSLSLVSTLGYELPSADDGRLALGLPRSGRARPFGGDPYVVVHPGASVPARAWAPERNAGLVERLAAAGERIVVTGGAGERDLTARVAGAARENVVDMGARTDFAGLCGLIREADAVVVGNTAPVHVAAAVGTPVACIYAPTVPAERWRPWMVPHELLGLLDIPCAHCRARACPFEGHPCVGALSVDDVLAALERLRAGAGAAEPGGALTEAVLA